MAFCWLSLCSWIFYIWWNPYYLPLFLISIIINFYLGKILDQHLVFNKLTLIIGITFNLGILLFYKYSYFIISNLSFLGISHISFSSELPLAISFYTFQQIAFLVDVYRRTTKPSSLLSYNLFVSFFPQLIAGPIVHHREIIPQFFNKSRLINWDLFSKGFTLFSCGLFKKVILADPLGNWIAPIFDASHQHSYVSVTDALGAALGFGLQLYFDFSGYSEMAIGLGLMFGITFPYNFFSPYKAKNISDFWRRWHITLSEFFRDYLYIPLGGNRCSIRRSLLNLIIVMALAGLWHGAGWNFLLWGIIHGVALAIHVIWKKHGIKFPLFFSWMFTFSFIMLAWILFRASTFNEAIILYQSLYKGIDIPCVLPKSFWYSLIALLSLIFFCPNAIELFYEKDKFLHSILGKIPMIKKQSIYNIIILIISFLCMIISVFFINKISIFLYFNF